MSNKPGYEQKYRETHREECRAKTKRWRDNHREQFNAYRREYSHRPEVKARYSSPEQKAKRNAYQKAWRDSHMERVNTRRKALYEKLRAEVLAFYGSKCVCCGEAEPHFLCLDHINGEGKKDRKRYGRAGIQWYCYLRREHPTHVQILCHNCNMAKGFYGICPHQLKEV